MGGWVAARSPRVDFLVSVATVTSDDLAEVPPSEFAPSVLSKFLHTLTHTQNRTGEFTVNTELHVKFVGGPIQRTSVNFSSLKSTFK